MVIDQCPESLLKYFGKKLKPLTQAWAKSDMRPYVKPQVLKKWDKLLEAWIANEKLPLFIRKHRNNRGAEFMHKNSKRKIIPADNGPAHWTMGLALNGECPTMKELEKIIKGKKIPVAMVLTRDEKKKCGHQFWAKADRTLNNAKWKLCHLTDIKLKGAHGKQLENVDLEQLKKHFHLFLSPQNMFLVPKKYAGIGELEEMRDAIKRNNR